MFSLILIITLYGQHGLGVDMTVINTFNHLDQCHIVGVRWVKSRKQFEKRSYYCLEITR